MNGGTSTSGRRGGWYPAVAPLPACHRGLAEAEASGRLAPSEFRTTPRHAAESVSLLDRATSAGGDWVGIDGYDKRMCGWTGVWPPGDVPADRCRPGVLLERSGPHAPRLSAGLIRAPPPAV
jgi:hypothetical protein